MLADVFKRFISAARLEWLRNSRNLYWKDVKADDAKIVNATHRCVCAMYMMVGRLEELLLISLNNNNNKTAPKPKENVT